MGGEQCNEFVHVLKSGNQTLLCLQPQTSDTLLQPQTSDTYLQSQTSDIIMSPVLDIHIHKQYIAMSPVPDIRHTMYKSTHLCATKLSSTHTFYATAQHTSPHSTHLTTLHTPHRTPHTSPHSTHLTTLHTPHHTPHTSPHSTHLTALHTPHRTPHTSPHTTHLTTLHTPHHTPHTSPHTSPHLTTLHSTHSNKQQHNTLATDGVAGASAPHHYIP